MATALSKHNESTSPESRSVTLALQGPKGWTASAQSTPLEYANKSATELHCIGAVDIPVHFVHAVSSSPSGMRDQKVAVYFQGDTTGPQLFPSVLVGGVLQQTPRFRIDPSCCRPI